MATAIETADVSLPLERASRRVLPGSRQNADVLAGIAVGALR
jgi:hypothetical protein